MTGNLFANWIASVYRACVSLDVAVWVGNRRRTVRKEHRRDQQVVVDSAHLEHGARRKAGGQRAGRNDGQSEEQDDDGLGEKCLLGENVGSNVDSQSGFSGQKTDKAPKKKAPLAGKKKKRGLDEDGDEEENQRGATKYLKYGKGIG